MPLILPVLAVERDDGGEEEVVALLRAAHPVIPRRAVADADEDGIVFGIISETVPDRATPAMFPPLACPGLGSHGLRFILEPVSRIARHGVEAPELRPRVRVIGRDIAAQVGRVGPAMADDHLACEDARRAADEAIIAGRHRHRAP